MNRCKKRAKNRIAKYVKKWQYIDRCLRIDGDKIGRLKLWRDAFSVGLGTAKSLVEKYPHRTPTEREVLQIIDAEKQRMNDVSYIMGV